MKKVTCLLVLLAMATSVSADVIFTGDGTGGKLSLSYTTTGGDLPRGFALKCTVQDGDMVTIDPGDITVPGIDSADLTNIDYAYTAIDGGGSYTIGEGHPLADPCNPGVLSDTTDIDYFSVCFGVLDNTGNQGAGPASASPLIEIPLGLWGDDPCVTICIDVDNLRGGVAGSKLTTNLPICVTVKPAPECFPNTYTTYADWVTMGRPPCWCAPPDGTGYQCDGDANSDTQTFSKYRVYTNDISLVIANWKKKINDVTLNPCADIDHKSQTFSKYRVYTNDLTIIITNWKKKDTGLPGDCPRPE